MRPRPRPRWAPATALLASLLASCEFTTPEHCDGRVRLEVEPPEAVLRVGERLRPSVWLRRCPTSQQVVVEWTSEAPEVVRVDETGVFEAVGPGRARVVAFHAASGLLGEFQVTVPATP